MAGDFNSAFDSLVYGNTDHLPIQESNIVRIFMSSTFTDTVYERNRLMKDIFPELRKYCQSKGVEFEVVDMRWGVRDDATSDHLTSELCMREIENCKRLSMGPCFVGFLGNKYGYRPFPPIIPSSEFKKLRQLVQGDVDPEAISLLDEWFLQDTNAVPPVHVLQPITTKLENFNNEENPDLQRADRSRWWQVFETLQRTLQLAATKAQSKGLYEAQQMHKYFQSVTEHEFRQALQDNQNVLDNCLFFIREIDNLQDDVKNKEARNYVDITDDGSPDTDALTLLHNLKTDFLPSIIPPESIHKYNVPWTPNGIDPSHPPHVEYLDDFCNTFRKGIMDLIDMGLKKRSEAADPIKKQLYTEMLQHATFCATKCSTFCGREDLLASMHGYVTQKPGKPLVVHGVSGSGKTSAMAMLVKNVRDWLGENYVVVFRFLGTSAQSSTIHETLQSVTRQICFAYGAEQPSSNDLEDYTELVQTFRYLLTTLPSKEKPLFIMLDSIDQLTSNNDAHAMHWLPKSFPEHVQIAISMLPDVNRCLNNIRLTLRDEHCYIEMPPIPKETGLQIMEGWLKLRNRTLTEEQKCIVSKAFQRCPQPLFLKILFESFVYWRSYLKPEDINLPTNAREAITQLVEKMERKHGKVFVEHCLGYVTVSRNGISDAELEDAFSCDDDVMNDVYQYWDPPVETVVRIPPSLWKRMRHDIEEFFVERQAVGKRVVSWYHRQFWEASEERYLKKDTNKVDRHRLLAEMYMGEYSEGTIRPITLRKRKKTFDNADRKAALQPLEFGKDMFNQRKLQELPGHLADAYMEHELIENCLGNFDWVLAKLQAFSFLELMYDFQTTNPEMLFLKETMYLASSILKADPCSLAGQIIGRLGNYSTDQYPLLKKFVGQARIWVTKNPMPLIIPRAPCLMPPGGPLKVTYAGHPSRVLKVACTRSGKIMVSACEDSMGQPMTNVWDLDTSELVHTLQLLDTESAIDAQMVLVLTPDDRNVIFGHTKLGVFDLVSGECQRVLRNDNECGISCLRVSEDGYNLVACSKEEAKVYVWRNSEEDERPMVIERNSNVSFVEFKGNSLLATACNDGDLSIISLDTAQTTWESSTNNGDVTGFTLSLDTSRLIVGTSDNKIRTWNTDSESSEPEHTLSGHKKPPEQLVPVSDRILISRALEPTVFVWDIVEGTNLQKLKGHDGNVTCLWQIPSSLADFGSHPLLVSGSKDDFVKIWDVNSGKCLNTLEGHSSWISDVTVVKAEDGARVLSACNDKTVKMWIPLQQNITKNDRHEGPPLAVVITDDAQYAVTSAQNDSTKFWLCQDGVCTHSVIQDAASLLVCHDNRHVIGGTPNGGLFCWDVASGSEDWTLPTAHEKSITQLCWGGDHQLVTGSADKTIKLWDLGTNAGENTTMAAAMSGHASDITCLAAATNRKPPLIVSAGKDGEVRIWNYRGACLKVVSHAKGVNSLSISSSNRYLASGAKDSVVSVWSLDNPTLGEMVASQKIYKDSVTFVLFTNDEKHLISGAHQGKKHLHVWKYLSKDQDHGRYLSGHHHAVMAGYLTKDGKHLITSSRDCTIKVWHLPTAELTASFDCQSQIKFFGFAEVAVNRYLAIALTKVSVPILDILISGVKPYEGHLEDQCNESSNNPKEAASPGTNLPAESSLDAAAEPVSSHGKRKRKDKRKGPKTCEVS
ncbi:NACHT domain- and WD repeat-containing protein 1-like [Amphiura filiformis]|uniref:NACHT domain- and WD repeat-containing protein 1-like n=1 Tax=Amphiura filiformis TaxID=82378 RepID=UPI003B21B92B